VSGFGDGFETEVLPGAPPIGRNSPQRCACGLYAEQLSGSPFSVLRYSNERSWVDLTDFLNQRDRDYCIGMISSRWAAKGANV
jgi:homogentisate 1,2-dioxygenase